MCDLRVGGGGLIAYLQDAGGGCARVAAVSCREGGVQPSSSSSVRKGRTDEFERRGSCPGSISASLCVQLAQLGRYQLGYRYRVVDEKALLMEMQFMLM